MGSLPTCRYNQCLAIITGVCSATSFVCLCIGLGTDSWLYAWERFPLDDSSAVGNATYRNARTGLWRVCVDDPREVPRRMNCSYTTRPVFPRIDEDEPGPTESIVLSIRWVALFPLGSLVILLIADVITIIGHWTATRVLNFLSGILSVIGGLVTLVGIVVYVSAVTGEAADNKPKPTAMDEPKFLYRYGPSFFVTVASFVGAEVTGVLSVHVYIHRYKQTYHKHRDLPPLTIVDGAASGGGGTTSTTSLPHPMSSTSLMTTPMSPRHQPMPSSVGTSRKSLPCSGGEDGLASAGTVSRWSNGHRTIGIRASSAGSGLAVTVPPSSSACMGIGGVSPGYPTDDDGSEETYSPLSESCYIGTQATSSGPHQQSHGTPLASSHLHLLQQQQLQLSHHQQNYHQQQQQQPQHEMAEYNAFAAPPPAYHTMNCTGNNNSSAGNFYQSHSLGGTAGVASSMSLSTTNVSTSGLRPEQQSLLAETYRRTTPV